ncbi:MAG: GspE/PulE family protein [Lentisphaerota bacterium]
MNTVKKVAIPEELTEIFTTAYKQRASDIHFEIFDNKAIIRFRIDGVMHPFKEIKKEIYPEYCKQIKIMSKMNSEEINRPQDGRIQLVLDDENIDLRVAVCPTVFGESMCLRILTRSAITFSLNAVFLTEEHQKILKEWTARQFGIILTSGPTGSGKTTTLYSLLNEFNKETHKIWTVEDPVEYILNGINQIQLNVKAGLTFSSILRSILRQDPDIVMIGEIRDSETGNLAVNTALSGHLVLSSMHAENATQGMIRMRDMGLESFLIKDALSGIMSQRLVRQLCKNCMEAYTVDKTTITQLGLPQKKYYRAKGCGECHNTGFKGRAALYEFFSMQKYSGNMFMNGCTADELRKQALKEGMISIRQDGFAKAAQGLTSIDEVLRVTAGTD